MTPDLPPQPPEGAPPAAIVAEAPQARPIVVDGTGYRYTIVGNTLLPEATIVAAVAGAADPRTAVNALHQEYLTAGYFLVTLVGKVDGTDVEFKVVQGRITELVASPEITPYFTSLQEREDISRAQIIRANTLAEAYASRQGMAVKINFEPGAVYGGSKFSVTETPIEGAKPWNAVLAFNNFGNRYSSRYIAQGNASWRPGGGLELTAGYAQGLPELTQESKGSSYKSGTLGGSLITPIGVYSVSFNQTYYQYGDAVSFFNPAGDVSTISLSGFQLAYADETTRIGFNESITHYTNVVTVEIGPDVPDFKLTDQNYDVVGLGFTFNKSYALFGLPGSLGLTLNANQGLSSRSGTFTNTQPGSSTPRFTMFQGSLSAGQGLPMGFSMSANLSGQWAYLSDTERLPSQQQWVLGGYGSLTAWYPGVVSGDSGYLARLSAAAPTWNVWEMSLTPTIFVEAAGARTSYIYPNVPNSPFLSDYGVGLSGTAFRRGTLNLGYAWPWRTRDVGTEIVDGSRARLFFNVAMSF